MSEATGGPPATVDSQDPLPESQWFWRRVFVFVVTAVQLAGVSVLIDLIAGSGSANQTDAYVEITRYVLLLTWFVYTYYLVAPSAEHVTRMWQTANVLRSGVGISSRKSATGADGSTASAQTVVGVGSDTGEPQKSVYDPRTGTGLPGNAGEYDADPLEEAPPANPELPEEPSWRA